MKQTTGYSPMAKEKVSLSKKLSRICGQVRSADGRMLHGAVVVCQGRETRTLTDGTFVLNDLPSGIYKLTVGLEGFEPAGKDITVREGEELVQDFRLSESSGTAKICGHVFDAESKKKIVFGGTVILVLPVTNRYKHIDKNGYYEFDCLPAGEYTIATSIPEYADNKAIQSVDKGETKMLDFFCKPLRAVEPSWG